MSVGYVVSVRRASALSCRGAPPPTMAEGGTSRWPDTTRRNGWPRLPPHVLLLLKDQHMCSENIACQHFIYISAESVSCSVAVPLMRHEL
ncbi:hypothetical protein E2C01_026007 [Portunus trituberculatus]|uniref:Uncharacterized protein n=1 Tax=Portunus trituberculatus TaxID=210409 RepID=A0A5B7EEN1_PORTR|nr:hypothetical protein [Portunus trituberculatus]